MEIKVNTNQIKYYFNLQPLAQTARRQEFVLEDAVHKNTIPLVNKAFLFGIEVEVEGVPNPNIKATHKSYWNITEDPSLRNNGIEFVSMPLRAEQIEYAMNQLNASLPPTANFSPRTSVHVHMNVRDLTIDQILGLLLVYTATEELLFDWAGETRTKNVFCVRLTDTNYVEQYKNFQEVPQDVVHRWNKYTALNFNPIETKGTVEFRHMAGTADGHRILTWINILSCIKIYVKTFTSSDIMQQLHMLNSTSQYEAFLMDVFHEYTKYILPYKTSIQEKMENALSYIKLANIAKELTQEKITAPQYTTMYLDELEPAGVTLDMPPIRNNTRIDLNEFFNRHIAPNTGVR